MADKYVDNVLGNDSPNTGGSSDPYKTIGKALSSGGGLTAGDTCYIKDNSPTNPYLLVTDESSEIEVQVSGTSGNRITIRPWDDGDTIVIDTEDPDNTKVFDLNGNDYLDFYDIEIDGSSQSVNQIEMCFDVNECSYIGIYRCNMHDIDLSSEAIGLNNTGQTPPANNIDVNDCAFADIADSVSSSSECIAIGGCDVNNVNIKRCTFSGTVDEGIKTQWQDENSDINTILIEACTFDSTVSGIDVAVKQARDVIVRECYFSSSTDEAIQLNGSVNVTIEDCAFFATKSTSINFLGATFGAKTFRNSNVIIQRNKFKKINLSGLSWQRAIYIRWVDDSEGPIKILNNTFHDVVKITSGGDAINLRLEFDGTVMSQCDGDVVVDIYNNIFTDCDGYAIAHQASGDPTSYGDSVTVNNGNNCYNNNTDGDREGSVPTGWTWANNGTEPGEVSADPKFIDDASDDVRNLRLRHSSPCIRAGDFTKLASRHGGQADIGGWEYGAPIGKRLQRGKYYSGPTNVSELFELVRMEI